MKKKIQEEDGTHKQWYEDAKKVSLAELPKFLSRLMNDYGHDYGTICHALAAGAIATASAMNKHEQGGITGFQAGAVMWSFIRYWTYSHNKTGLSLIDYDNFLYPQYERQFQKTLTPETWQAIRGAAKTNIQEADAEHAEYLVVKEQYDKDIAAFVLKYPDYYEKRDYYDHLGMGNGAEWEAYYKKRDSGFEFAPHEPYAPISKSSPVYSHWESIVKGKVPFGYRVQED